MKTLMKDYREKILFTLIVIHSLECICSEAAIIKDISKPLMLLRKCI